MKRAFDKIIITEFTCYEVMEYNAVVITKK